MTFLARLRSFLRAALRRRAFEREMESDLQFHLDARVADLLAQGLERSVAEQQARRELGDPLRWKEEGREARGLSMIDQAVTDLRYAFRSLVRKPAFALTAISTLSLAIAANTTMFALADAAMFRSLPFSDAERLIWIASVRSDNPSAPFTLPEYMDYRERSTSLAGLAAYGNWSASLSGDAVTERFQGARLSANAFDVLGVSAAAGRLLTDADDRADASRVVVISHRLWQQRFGGALDVVGRQLRINGEPVLVVGVLPVHFPLPLKDIDVIAPLVPDRDPLRHARASVNFLRFFGRLAPGVDVSQAKQELTAISLRLREEFPAEYARKQAVSAAPLSTAIVGDLGPTMLILLVSVAVLLTTALANLLCLLLVRTNERRAEIAVRVALGASRPRLIRQVAVEALALTIVAGTIGAGLAALAASSAPNWAPSSIPRLAEVTFDSRAALCASALTLAASMLFTLAPLGTLFHTRADQAMRLVSRSGIGSRWNHRLRDSLVVAEIAAALVLLLATSVLARDFSRLQRVEPGFTPASVFQARVSLPTGYRTPADLERFSDQMEASLTQLPGVTHAGLISAAPLSGVLAMVPFSVVGDDQSSAPGSRASTNYRVITPGYLAAAGTRLIRGRAFTDRDDENGPNVALVSQAFADRYPGADLIGRRVMVDDNNTGSRPLEVVGIVENVRHTTMSGAPGLDLYVPLAQVHQDVVAIVRNNQFWMIRSETGPAALNASFVKALQSTDRDAAVSGMGTMAQGLETWFAPRRFSLAMFVVFALVSVLLAVTGLYGLVAYAVSQRRREIGLRMALGASIADIRRLILGAATRLGLAGISIGVVIAFAARPVKTWLIGDAPIDLLLAGATATGLLLVVMVAGAVPARRASRIDPTVALNSD